MKKISAQTRERAAQVCSKRATWAARRIGGGGPFDEKLPALASRAFDEAWRTLVTNSDRSRYIDTLELYAEAECLLRCGWSPS